jgi:amidase
MAMHPVRPSQEGAASPDREPATPIDRRTFLQLGAAAGAGAGLLGWAGRAGADAVDAALDALDPLDVDIEEHTIAEMQAAMESGELTSRELVRNYLGRIRRIDEQRGLNSLLVTNPDALDIARLLDIERQTIGPRGPLHGIPILLKDNIDTHDQMMTTAGSLALVGTPALQDATVTARLRDAGAVVLGKLNLSEWANFRGFASSSGWSGVGGQTNNPYILDRNPCGSSSGSGAAVAASLCAGALATETDGSIVCPASQCGVVGIKPTVGLTSRAGVVPISSTQDTVGTHGRTVADAAAMLGALTGVDPRDPATQASDGHFFSDYTQFADPQGLQGARIGIARQFLPSTAETDAVFETAVQTLRDAGAEVVDPVEIPTFDEFFADPSEIIVLVYEFKRDLNAYLATRTGVPVASLADCIQFNLDHFEQELQFFGQEWMELAQDDTYSQAEYEQALITGPALAGAGGIDATLANYGLDAIVAPTNTPAWPNDVINGDAFLFGSSSFAAVAGYPLVTVPMGNVYELPVGITFMASAWSEPTLIRLAAGFEAAAQARRTPRYLRTFNEDNPGSRRRPARAWQGRNRRGLERMLRTMRRPLFL